MQSFMHGHIALRSLDISKGMAALKTYFEGLFVACRELSGTEDRSHKQATPYEGARLQDLQNSRLE